MSWLTWSIGWSDKSLTQRREDAKAVIAQPALECPWQSSCAHLTLGVAVNRPVQVSLQFPNLRVFASSREAFCDRPFQSSQTALLRALRTNGGRRP